MSFQKIDCSSEPAQLCIGKPLFVAKSCHTRSRLWTSGAFSSVPTRWFRDRKHPRVPSSKFYCKHNQRQKRRANEMLWGFRLSAGYGIPWALFRRVGIKINNHQRWEKSIHKHPPKSEILGPKSGMGFVEATCWETTKNVAPVAICWKMGLHGRINMTKPVRLTWRWRSGGELGEGGKIVFFNVFCFQEMHPWRFSVAGW